MYIVESYSHLHKMCMETIIEKSIVRQSLVLSHPLTF